MNWVKTQTVYSACRCGQVFMPGDRIYFDSADPDHRTLLCFEDAFKCTWCQRFYSVDNFNRLLNMCKACSGVWVPRFLVGCGIVTGLIVALALGLTLTH
jgi:hypothetical protein